MSLYRDSGVVLRTIRLGEADRIITLMTEGHGKVRAVAKGVRKTKSRFGGRLEPLRHVAVLLYEGRELDIVTQAETIDHFRTVREDLDRLAKATVMLEAVDGVAQERERNVAVYQLLVGALRALTNADAPAFLPAFFFKLLSAEGVHPLLDHCASCGATEALVSFELSAGGVLCRGCAQGVRISPEALALLREVLGGGLGRVLRLPESAATRELERLASRAFESHLERRLRSPSVLDLGE